MEPAEFSGWDARAVAWGLDEMPREIGFEEARSRILEGRGYTWLHVRATPEAGPALLIGTFDFHPLAVEDALTETERPVMREHDGTLYLSAPIVVQRAEGEAYLEVGFFLRGCCLVSVSRTECDLVAQELARVAGGGPRVETPAMRLYTLLDAILDGFFPAADRLEDDVDELGDEILNQQLADLPKLMRCKRRLLDMRRHLAPLRDILNGCLRRDLVLIEGEARPYFQDLYDHSLRVIEIVDTNRDILASVLDAHLASVSNNLNAVMRTLTVISTALMTAALVAGIYGMNFRFMPELAWPLGYPLALGTMALLVAIEVWFFRRKGWI